MVKSFAKFSALGGRRRQFGRFFKGWLVFRNLKLAVRTNSVSGKELLVFFTKFELLRLRM